MNISYDEHKLPQMVEITMGMFKQAFESSQLGEISPPKNDTNEDLFYEDYFLSWSSYAFMG